MAKSNGMIGAAWPRCAASLAVFRGDSLLLIARGKGHLKGRWTLPGGHIEPGERAREAALRETLEETGVEADEARFLDLHEVVLRQDGLLTAHYLIAVFCARWRAGEPVAQGDAAQARFVAISDLGSLPLTDGLLPLIDRARRLLSR